jgi:dTDP-4-amino-4,6-dideoxygalactose transaminase
VFCDVEAGTGLIDADAAAAAVGPRTAAIIAVHLYGQAADMDAVHAVARRHGLVVFEDAAQAHGARHRDQPVGSLGDAAAFSFYPSKNLGALGDGGAICTDDAMIAERARMLRNIGQRSKGEHVILGANERLDGLQAAFLRAKLPYLAETNDARRDHAAAYRAGLPPELLLEERPHTPCVYHLFPIRVDDRDAAARQLAADGIATGVHYSRTAADYGVWEGQAVAEPAQLERAREWAANELSLPMFPELTEHEASRVIAACANLEYAKGEA